MVFRNLTLMAGGTIAKSRLLKWKSTRCTVCIKSRSMVAVTLLLRLLSREPR